MELGQAHTHSIAKPVVWLDMNDSWPELAEDRMSVTSFLHSSFFQMISAVVLWLAHAQLLKLLGTSALTS